MPPPFAEVVGTPEPPGSQPPPTPAPAAQPFRCQVSRQHGTATVRLIGELDLATVPILLAEIAALRAAGLRRLILDLRQLGFMDSAGLHYVLDTDAEARQDGFSIALVAGPPTVQRVFELTGTLSHLPFIDP